MTRRPAKADEPDGPKIERIVTETGYVISLSSPIHDRLKLNYELFLP